VSALYTLFPRYNVGWKAPPCEAVNAQHLSDSDWRKEDSWCNPPWPYYPISSKNYDRAAR
jgi:hypothetical protein